MSEKRIVQLPEWHTGERRLRYLFLCAPCSFTLYRGHRAEGNLVPVFLGSDVVSQSGIRTENHPKIHAKFAKKGLATKLNFSPDFKFEKLRLPGGLNSLWFYSIQGVFKVAFDLYSREEQLAVIENLQELWKSHLKDDHLRKCYELNTLLEDTDYDVPACNRMFQPKSQFGCSSHVMHEISRVPQRIPAEHNYCMTKNEESSMCHSQDTVSNDFFNARIKYLLGLCSNKVMDTSAQLMKTLVSLLDVAEHALSGQKYLDNMITSIIELLEAASHLQDKENVHEEVTSVYDNRLLLEVSSWLGNRFHSENDCISQQVEEFKRKHIDRISDLPPAEELVAALFPNAMKVLLLKWMGLFDDASLSKLQSEYPILLLILEFANRNLITGVAHVLYSTLICK